MRSLQSLPPTSSPLHLYRALLRECTYLPDTAARAYGFRYVRDRFKRLVNVPQTPSMVRNARQGLSLLLRASEGKINALKRVLMLTYGRARQRRTELLTASRERLQDLDKDFKLTFEESLQPGKDIQLPPSLKLLYETQQQRAPKGTRFKLEDIPATNAKGFPMPEIRLPRLRYKAVKPLMTKLLAPLPDDEWDRLLDIVSRKAAVGGLVPRRKQPAEGDVTSNLAQLKVQTANGKQQFVVCRPRRKLQPVSKRAMRRIYAQILENSPRLRKDSTSGKWTVEYASLRDLKKTTRETLHPVFANITEHGRLLPNVVSSPDTSTGAVK